MAVLSRSAIRQRVATAIDAISGYAESVHDYDTVGEDPNSFAHKSFAVGILETTPIGGRQRLSEGAYVATTVGVRSTYKLRPKDRITSGDEALDGQGEVIKAVFGIALTDINLELTEMRRPEFVNGEWFFVETLFRIQHHLALQ